MNANLVALAETLAVPFTSTNNADAIVVFAPSGSLFRIWEDDNVLAIGACDKAGYVTGADQMKLTNGHPALALALVSTVLGL